MCRVDAGVRVAVVIGVSLLIRQFRTAYLRVV